MRSSHLVARKTAAEKATRVARRPRVGQNPVADLTAVCPHAFTRAYYLVALLLQPANRILAGMLNLRRYLV
jgi:hypothetical protein